MLRDVRGVATGPERRAFWIAVWLAFANQACASTSVISYAPVLLERVGGVPGGRATLLSTAIAGSKLAGVALSIALVDRAGRRPLLLAGSAGCSAMLMAAGESALACGDLM